MDFDIRKREDRIGRYFRKYLDRFIFMEFTDEFIKQNGNDNLLKGIPVPWRKEEIQEFVGGKGISLVVIAENIARVIGSDPHFKYTNAYIDILLAFFDKNITGVFLKEGNASQAGGEMETACVYYRAALCIDPQNREAMYSYACVCREIYLDNENEEYVGRFKAESFEWFEILTIVHPEFDMGYYYLGYAYLNMGLYLKAKLTWNTFLKISGRTKEISEIKQRREQLEDAVRIEEGCNKIDAGNIAGGMEILETYKGTHFSAWWPLHYYLGRGYKAESRFEDAVNEFKAALRLNAGNIETMKELTGIYEYLGDWVNAKKYSEKIKLVEEFSETDHNEYLKQIQEENKRLENEFPNQETRTNKSDKN